MELFLLHLDDALTSQSAFMNTCEHADARHIDAVQAGSEIRLWGKDRALANMRNTLEKKIARSTNESPLVFMGSGDFHHVTALLLPLILHTQAKPVTVIHFDNHPDWVSYEGGMHCGSWVNHAASHPAVAKVITIGVCSHDLRRPDWKGANLKLLSQGMLELFPYSHAPSRVRSDCGSGASYRQKNKHLHWRTIEETGEQAFIDMLLPCIATSQVYITIDKDVLAREDAQTNWDQGKMRLPFLLQLLREIGERHAIIGADVTGDYSTPHYGGSHLTRIRKKAERWLEQPFYSPETAEANALNSATNHALLAVLSEVM